MDGQKQEYQGIDIDKALSVFSKSIIWIILILLITNTTAYLIIRWTKPLYESSSELKLDVETNASELGIAGIRNNENLNLISGEIEILRSKLFFNKVLDNFDLGISYYTIGNVLDDEKYNASPFEVTYRLKNNALFNRRIKVDIVDTHHYVIDFGISKLSNKYRFNEKVETDDIDFTLHKTGRFDINGEKSHFFIINSREALIGYLGRNLRVTPLNFNANTIKISFTDHNPSKARDLVNAIDSIYLDYTQEEKNAENRQKINWLNNELQEIESQLEGFEDYFENFTIKNKTSNLDAELENTIGYINVLDSQRYEVTNRVGQYKKLLESIKKDNFQNTPEAYSANIPKNISASIIKLRVLIDDYNDLKRSYTESTFVLTKKEMEIENLKADIRLNLEASIKRSQEKLDELNDRKKKLQRDFIELPGKSTEYNKNQRFFKLYEEFYMSLMQSKAQYQIAQAGTVTKFKILSAATASYAPISPDKLIIHGIGLVAGLILSFFFVGIRYLLNNHIATPQELEKLTDAPILGYIPEYQQRMDVSELMVDERPKSAISESLRSIRTNIEFLTTSGQSRVYSVTSTVSGEGKTFTAVNLGGIIAMSQKKVIILDLDMRKPRVHMSFGKENHSTGISTLLIKKSALEDCINSSRINNLDYINAGPTPPNPAELLLSSEFDNILERLKEIYDVIILDTPPVGLVTDGILAMKKADLAMYLVRANYSKQEFLKTLNRLHTVNQFKHIAVLLNALPNLRSNNYGYGYGYYDNKGTRIKSKKRKTTKK